MSANVFDRTILLDTDDSIGQNRVQPNIQSVLIVTKARDNRLIKLTRELALYLMLKPSKTGRGMIVYVSL